jgi:26S proteasome regulatory subunit T4
LWPGRLDRTIEIPEPNETQRFEILKIHASKHGDIDYESIVKLADGLEPIYAKSVPRWDCLPFAPTETMCARRRLVKAARKILDNKKLESKLDYSKV